MRIPKKALYLALIMVVMLIAASCGGEGEPEAAPEEPEAELTEETPADEDTEAGEETPAEGEDMDGEDSASGAVSFEGEQIRLIVATGVGGGFDVYARMLVRYWPEHIPGEPSILVENRPGGGHRVGSSYIFNAAPNDGTEIGFFFGGLVLQNAMGDPTIEWDASEFEWLGAPTDEPFACVVRSDAAATTIEGMRENQITLGANVRGNVMADIPILLNEAAGTQIRVVTGYPSQAEIIPAMDRGEVEAMCTSWESIVQDMGNGIDAGEYEVFAVLSTEPMEERSAYMRDDVWIGNIIEDEAQLELIQIYISTQATLNKALALPPGTPEDIVQTHRAAFNAIVEDTRYINEIVGMGRSVNLITGEELTGLVDEVFQTDQGVLDQLKEILEYDF